MISQPEFNKIWIFYHKVKDDDELQEGVNLGVVSLNPDIIEKLNKPESHVVLTWGGKDPTLFKDA